MALPSSSACREGGSQGLLAVGVKGTTFNLSLSVLTESDTKLREFCHEQQSLSECDATNGFCGIGPFVATNSIASNSVCIDYSEGPGR